MHIILRSQSGKSDYVSVNRERSLQSSVADHLSISEEEFGDCYSLVHSGKVISPPFLPKDLSDGSTVVLLHKSRKHIFRDEEDQEEIRDENLDIEKLIDKHMKKYAKPDIEIELDQEKVQMLCEMGFSEGRVRRALTLQYSDTEQALNWLLSHEGDPSADEPLTQKELRAIVKAQETFKPDEKQLTDLLEMGFSREEAIHALKFSKNSFEGAVAFLTGDNPPSNLQNPMGMPNDPRIAAIMRDIVSHPERLPNYMNHPELGPLLMELLNQARQ